MLSNARSINQANAIDLPHQQCPTAQGALPIYFAAEFAVTPPMPERPIWYTMLRRLETGPMNRSPRLYLILCSFTVAFVALSLKAQAPAQDSAQPPQAPAQPSATLSIAAREVLLDVVVTDHNGNPVTGLTPADFTVVEEGDPQRLTNLEEHHPMSAEDLARLKSIPPLPPNTFTNFAPVANTNASTVILLDSLDSPVQAQMELRQQLIDYLKHMQPGTPIAIFQIDTEMRLIQGFTADPAVLLDAAKGKRDMPSLQKPIRGTREEYNRARLDILRSGFQLMGRYLGGFPGRKNLIWLTGSIPGSYRNDPLGTSFGKSFKDDFSVQEDSPGDLMDALTLSRVSVYPIDIRGLQTLPQFNAGNAHGPSPGANMRFEGAQAFQHMDLDTMAEQTGGKAYYNTNGFKEIIGAIVSNGSDYYTLAYATTNTKWEGQFRRIKVTVNRPGLQVQYRHGYYAVDRAKQEQRLLASMAKRKASAANNPFGDDQPADADAPPADAAPNDAGALIKHPKGGFEATMQLGAIPPTEVIFTANLAVDDKVEKLDKNAPLPADNYLEANYKGKPFRTYTVKIHADARAFRMNREADGRRHGTVEFVTLVFDQQGNRVNSMLSTAVINLSEDRYQQLLAHGLSAQEQIAVPVKGNYFLRVGVHDVPSDHIGALEIPVDEVHAGVAELNLPKP
jgi:VWFA-related protein